MLLAPFLWIFCEFDEKVLDNLSLGMRIAFSARGCYNKNQQTNAAGRSSGNCKSVRFGKKALPNEHESCS